MLWLLPYFGYAFAASAIASAAGYAAVTRFSVVQRVLAVALDRTLQKISKNADGTSEKYSVDHTDTGVIAMGIIVGTATLQAAKGQVAAVSINRLEVDFPSFSRPMSIRVHGVHASLQQMQMPEHVSPEEAAASERRRRRDDKRLRLEIVEELLWGKSATGAPPARQWNPAGAYLGRLQAKALQKTIAFVAQFVRMEITDLEVEYIQRGEPGPRPCTNYLQGADGAVLHMRSLSLAPQGTAAAHLVGDGDEVPLPSSEPASPMDSPRNHTAAAHGEEPSWWQALASIPHLLWSHVVTTRPSATKLTVSGVSMVLKTYPSTWQGYHAAVEAAAAPVDPFAFTAGARGSRRDQMPSSGKRRRQGASAAASGSTADGEDSSQSKKAAGLGSSARPSATPAAAAAAPKHAPWIDHAAALRLVTAEEHVLFRQWEFSVMLCLLPPGYESIEGVTLTPLSASSVPPSSAPTEQASPAAGNTPRRRRGSLESAEENGTPHFRTSHLMEVDGESADPRSLEHILSGGLEDTDELDDEFMPSKESLRAERSTSFSEYESEYGTPIGSPAASRGSSRDPSPSGTRTTPPTNGSTPYAEAAAAAIAAVQAGGVSPAKAGTSTTPATSPAKSQRGGGTSAAAPAGSSKKDYVLDVSITLKALVPEFNTASIAILSRVVDRQRHLSNYGSHWKVRPQVPVASNEAKWWQYAGRALAAGVRRAARREVPLSRLAARQAARLEYQSIYAGKHASNALFQEPGRRWYHLRRVRAIDEGSQERLQALEDSLTLEELAHFRLGVAARYNRRLADDPNLIHFVADKIDGLVCTRRDGVQASLADLLLHRDRQPQNPTTVAQAQGSKDGGILFGLRVSCTCPKLGVSIDARTFSDSRPVEEIGHIVLSLHGVAAEVSTEGSVELRVVALQCGPAKIPTSPVEPRVISCPSTVCERVCKAAEFFRYAMTGSVLSESLTHRADGCVRVTISPRYGLGGMVVADESASAAASTDHAASEEEDGEASLYNWHPAGFDIVVHAAAVGIVYNGDVAMALLAMADACDQCKAQPWRWSLPAATPQDHGASSTTWPPPLLQRPESVDEMVVAAFAAAQLPTLGRLALPATTLDLQCPGVAIQLPYNHRNVPDVFKGSGKRHATRPLKRADQDEPEVSSEPATRDAADTARPRVSTPKSPKRVNAFALADEGVNVPDDTSSDEYPAEGLLYMFTVTVQNIRVRVTGEDFGLALRGGTSRRIDADGYIDAFSYLSHASRRLIARNVMPGRVVYDAALRQFTEEVSGVDMMEEELREIEIACMAKVWAYPEDMPAIMRAIKERDSDSGATFSGAHATRSLSSAGRSYSMGGDAASGLAQAMPTLLVDPGQYPVPLIPYLKAGAVRGTVVRRLSAAPGEPGGAVSAAAVSMNGVQAWVSPMHVWHMMSLENKVREMVNYLLKTPIAESVVAERKAASEMQTLPELPVPRPSRRLIFTLDIDEVSLLWLIGTWTSKEEPSWSKNPSSRSRYSRAWGITVKPGDPAYLWAQWLAPVYSASLARISAAVRVQASGAIAAGASIDGIILRDLQLPDVAKHAYVLRPLPARARRLNAWLQGVRRGLLGITETSPARMLWQRAFCKIALRQKTSRLHMYTLLEADQLSGHKTQHAILGPQIIVRYTSCAPTPAGMAPSPARPQAELTAEIGQMLAYVRIKKQASMTAFATQLTQLIQTVATDGAAGEPAPSTPARPAGPSLQSSLRIDVVVVGIDVLFRVQSQDLMSLKLQQGRVTLDRKAVTRTSLPKDIRLHVSASVQDIVLRDMKADPEHALVLIPNSGADYCSFGATYVSLVDTRRRAPCLTLSLQNPRVLLLFRFVVDIMDAVGIIGSAVTQTKAGGKINDPEPPATATPAVVSGEASKPLELVVQLENVGIIVPTGSTTRTVLAGQIEHFMLALPGKALPTDLLTRSELPTLDEMLAESLLSNMTFKFSGFHDPPPGAPAPVPKAMSPTEAEREAEAKMNAPSTGNGAAPTGAGGTSKATQPPTKGSEGASAAIKRGGMFSSARQREVASNAGVLFFEEEDDDATHHHVGVLHLDDYQPRPASRASNGDDLEDNVLAAPSAVAKQVVGAARRFMGNVRDAIEGEISDIKDTGHVRQRDQVVMEKMRPESRESAAGGAPAVPLGDRDADDATVDLVGMTELPQATMALCIEQFSVTTGTLVRVPSYFRHSTPATSSGPPRQGSFIPPSLSSFSWPSEVYDVVPRGPLLHPANISMIHFTRQYDAGKGSSPQMHFSCTPLTAVISAPNYTTIMDFVHSNLDDLLSPPDKPPAPPRPKELSFNPAMKFGPALGAVATFRMTLAVPKVSVVFEAHPREWTDLDPSFIYTSAAEAHSLRPFFHASMSNLLMDLGKLPPGDTFITFCATSLDLQDLRLGYRLTEVSQQVPGDVSYEVQEMAVAPLRRWQGLSSDSPAPDETPHPDPFTNIIDGGSIRPSGSSNYGSPGGSLDSPMSWASDADTPRTPQFAFHSGAASEEHPTPGMGSGQSSTNAQGGLNSRYTVPATDAQQAPNTGIRLSVARRLSEHSHRHRGFSNDGSATPGTHGAPTPGRNVGATGSVPRHYLPLLDFVELPEVRPSLGSEAASLRVLTAPHHAPAEERLPAGTTDTHLPGSNINVRLEVSVGILADSTMAVEVALSSALLQWPYFQDLSLISSIANVFKSGTPEERESVNDDAPIVRDHGSTAGPSSWLYVNTVLTETEIFVPVLDVEVAEHMAAELWGQASGSGEDVADGDTPPASPRKNVPKNGFQRVADLALATMLLDSTGRPEALALEERGMALSSTVIRVAYAAGGDGESVIQADLRELAMFIRDPRARINCILQPFSCSVEVRTQVPNAAEHMETDRLHRAAITIQRQWRRCMAARQLREQYATLGPTALETVASLSYALKRHRSRSASGEEGRGRQWMLVDELIMDVASPHTRSLLSKYKRTSRDQTAMLHVSQFRPLSTRSIQIRAGALTARAAFSHIPFWQAAVDSVRRVILAPAAGDSLPASPSNKAGGAVPAGPLFVPFRPHALQVAVTMESAALVLCNDKPETFGAPDVLQYSVTEANLVYDAATLLPDRPANKVGRLALSTYASFLNSGTSRWEPLYDLWPLTAEYVDRSSSTYVSDQKTNLWISSDRHLNITFNPASLMSFGDALAFLRAFDDRTTMDEPPTPLGRTATENHLFSASAPADRAQVTTSVTSRAPQKYLIQNQSGMRLYYWADATGVSSTGRSQVIALDNGGSETLRVAPASKRLTFLQFTSAAAGTERNGSVITMHFEGNWMPMRDVAVNVVGKYRYSMVSPADNTSVPVLIDIILVGRTKIITVHSGIWVENNIQRPISLRLHVPTTSLVPPPAMTGAGSGGEGGGGSCNVANGEGDINIGPLAPKAGCYLPLTAALGGLLFVQPDGYAEASRDVIRLSTDVDELLSQQGYITCDPISLPGGPEAPLHVAMEATRSRVLSEFQAFKHMECVAAGTIQRATTPLEVTLSIQPTMVLSNALPYEMRVLLWQVAPPDTPGTPTAQETGKKRGRKADPLPAQTPGTAHHASLLEMLSPRTSVAVPVPKRGSPGRYFCYSIPPGGEQDIYVDMRQNVLMHVSVEEINMRSVKWSLCSWAQRMQGRGDARETQFAAKLPKDVQLRMVGVGMPLPTNESEASAYLIRLKDAASHLRAVHAQFNRDARAAVTSADIKVAVGRVKNFARRIGKHNSKSIVPPAAKEAPKAAPLTSARPVPPRGTAPPLSPPSAEDPPVAPSPTLAPESAPTPVLSGVEDSGELTGSAKKRRVSFLQRFGGSKSKKESSPAVPAEQRPVSASSVATSAGTSSSPDRQLLSSRKQKSDAPQAEVELVRPPPAPAATVASTAPAVPAPTPAAWPLPPPPQQAVAEMPPAAPAASQRRIPPPRPPPIEISEEPVIAVDENTGMARTPFDVWTREDPPVPPRARAQGTDDEEEAEVRAPPVLHVGVYNSLADQEMHQAGVCRITLYVPFWLNNRTGVDLFYQDKASAPPNPLLLGNPLPWSYGEVFTPGTSMTDAFDKEVSPEAAGPAWNPNASSTSLFNPPSDEAGRQGAVLEYKLVLMNKQEEVALGLAHVRCRRYAQPVNIKTVGNKGSVELRGPAAQEPTVPEMLAKGLRQAAAAGAGIPLSAVERLRQLGEDPFRTAPVVEMEPSVQVNDLEAAHAEAAGGPPRSLSRRSVGDRVVDVVSTQPGTMLVRMDMANSSGNSGTHMRQLPSITRRRQSASLQHSSSVGSAGVAEADAAAALEAMQKVPAPHQDLENIQDPGASPAPTRQQLSEATGGKQPLATKDERDAAAAAPDAAPERASDDPIPAPVFGPTVSTQERFVRPQHGETLIDLSGAVPPAKMERQKAPVATKGQRLFEFAVDVTAGPPESIYRHTKLVTLKPKYIIENQTGVHVDVKQLNGQSPQGDVSPSPSCRFARTLAPGQRAAVYWDDAELSRELVVRPRLPGEEPDAWNWSGGFPIPDTEWYFGLRIRHRQGPRRYINIPVNVTVGSSGSVQVTLKSPASVPPYRIENVCKDVQLYMVQVPLVFREEGSMYVDSLQPGDVMPYAWDEPTMLTKLRVQAKVSGRTTESRVADFSLDVLGDAPMMMLPTHGEAGGTNGTARRLYRTLSTDLPEELKKKLVSLLAAEFSKKVYVSVYADGPTRVLRFSDEKNVSSLEQQNVVLDLAARLKQVELQLRTVNSQFAYLSGASGAHAYGLDLYGRMPVPKDDQAVESRGMLQRRTSRKLPLPEATRTLVHMASRNLEARHTRGASFTESPSASPSLQLPVEPSLRLGSRQSSLAASRGASPSLGGAARERQTVRFDKNVSFSEGTDGSQVRRPAAGVLEVEDPDQNSGSEGLPYRHLIIRTGTEPVVSGGEAMAAAAGPSISDKGKGPMIAPSGSSSHIRRAESRDWGHITSDPAKGATTRAMGTSGAGAGGSGGGAAGGSGGGTASAGPNVVSARRQELLKLMTDGDAVLLIGGDLNITVVQARGLTGPARSTHPFARVHIRDPVPPPGDEHRSKQTSVVWQSGDPVWDEQLLFRDVCAASELVVEVWDLGGTRSSAQLKALGTNPAEVIKSCRFLGRAEVPLGETLDVPAGTPLWFPLMRRSAADAVSGQLQLRFLWDVTARGLLSIKLAALEQVLAQRREILAALKPVPVRAAMDWAKPDPSIFKVAAAAGENIDHVADAPGSPSKGAPGGNLAAVWSIESGSNMFTLAAEGTPGIVFPVSRVSTKVLARHSQDHSQRHLVVTVLEARGLNPRRGVVVALSDNELPNPVVTLEVPGYPAYTTPVQAHTLTPRWPANRRHILRGVDPATAAITVKLGDQRSGLRHNVAPLGVGTIHASNIRGENPVYVWVPLRRPGRRRRDDLPENADNVPEVHVFLRLQWQTEIVRGSSVKVDIDAAGAGLMVVGGLQDEIFNFTVDSLKASAVRTRQELTVAGTVARVQLDNQMLNAVEPVVLAPDASARLAGAEHQGPLITFAFVRSYAGSQGAAVSGAAAPSEMGGETSASSVDLGSVAGDNPADGYGIRSFKEIRLTIAPMDFITDEGFLEALLSFVTSLPTADIWQDKPWQEQQRRLLTAQFGPREVESLAINAVVVAPAAPVAPSVAGSVVAGAFGGGEDKLSALSWVLDKEARDLEALHGQSDLSSWFFIESAEVGTITLNVTVSISSRLLAAGQNLPGSAFNRALGASGYQLVNVSNVPITLGHWVVGNDPTIRGRFSNGFLSQRALASNLTRHYTFEALKEAHKVLGGAGPAVASVPLTVLWASGSAFVLLRQVTTGKTTVVGAVQQVVYVPMMTMSMFVSSFSRMLAAGIAFIPPERLNGDDETLRRIIRRPQNSFEAIAGAPKELVWGMRNALQGFALDPVAGWHAYHIPGFVLGVFKGFAGLPIRPLIGSLEFTSKGLAAMAMSALGRDGIVGKVQRRVRAPGAFADDGTDAMEAGPRSEAQVHARALQAAWQRVLPEFFPAMAGDTVTDVINVRATRVVLITDRHVAYLRARHLREHSVYKAKWLVPITEIQNLRGDPETRKITINHVHRYDLKLFGFWPVQKRKGLRCGSRPMYERTILRLTKVQQAVQSGGALEEAGHKKAFEGANMAELTILSAPYVAPGLLPPGMVGAGAGVAQLGAASGPGQAHGAAGATAP